MTNGHTPCPVANPRAVIGAFTGIACGPFSEIQEYGDSLVGHPTWTHEYGDKEFVTALKQKAKPDFLLVCEWLGQFSAARSE